MSVSQPPTFVRSLLNWGFEAADLVWEGEGLVGLSSPGGTSFGSPHKGAALLPYGLPRRAQGLVTRLL